MHTAASGVRLGEPIPRLLLTLVAGTVFLAGCGVQAYEQQLNEANELFDYQNRLNEALSSSVWTAPGDFGISLRVPLGFAQIAAPPPASESEGAAGALALDPRQPAYLGIRELPGLIAAWRATMPTTDGSQAVVFLYLLGNHQRFLDRQPGEGRSDPRNYLDELESLLESTLGVTLADSGRGDNVRLSESIPRDEKFARKQDFVSVRIVPANDVAQRLRLPDLWVYLYEHRAGPVQVALLLVAPQSLRDNPEKNLRLALETLQVSDQPPKRPRPGESAAGRRQADF